MRLHLHRSMRTAGWFGRSVYAMSLVADIDDIELALIDAHNLHPVEIWASAPALAFDHEAEQAFEDAQSAGGWWQWSFGSSFKQIGLVRQGLRSARHGLREARVTIGDLVNGMTLQAGEVRELSEAELGIRAGFENIRSRMEALVAFEDNSQAVVDWPQADAGGAPARDWFEGRVRR